MIHIPETTSVNRPIFIVGKCHMVNILHSPTLYLTTLTESTDLVQMFSHPTSQEFPAFYPTWSFIFMLTRSYHWNLTSTRWLQWLLLQHISFRTTQYCLSIYVKVSKWPLFLQSEFCMQFSPLTCVNSSAYHMCKIGLRLSFEYNYKLSDYCTGIVMMILHLGLYGLWSFSIT